MHVYGSGKKKAEIRRRIRAYEQLLSQSSFGYSDMCVDLENACTQSKNVHEVVLIAYAIEQISLSSKKKHHNAAASLLEDYHPDKQSSDRFCDILWLPTQTACGEPKESPLVLAINAAARDVVRFIVIWYLVSSLADEKPSVLELDQLRKRTVLEWSDAVGDPKVLFTRKIRSALENYPSLNTARHTLASMVSCLAAPYVEPYPCLRAKVNKVLEQAAKAREVVPPAESNDNVAASREENQATNSGCVCDQSNVLEEDDDKSAESYSLCESSGTHELDEDFLLVPEFYDDLGWDVLLLSN